MNIFQNLHFTDNQTADKSDKAYEMHIVINHLNKVFQDAMSVTERQSIDECMITLEYLIEQGWGGIRIIGRRRLENSSKLDKRGWE